MCFWGTGHAYFLKNILPFPAFFKFPTIRCGSATPRHQPELRTHSKTEIRTHKTQSRAMHRIPRTAEGGITSGKCGTETFRAGFSCPTFSCRDFRHQLFPCFRASQASRPAEERRSKPWSPAGADFHDDADRNRFIGTLTESCAKTDWQVHARGLMPNRFPPVMEALQSAGGNGADGGGAGGAVASGQPRPRQSSALASAKGAEWTLTRTDPFTTPLRQRRVRRRGPRHLHSRSRGLPRWLLHAGRRRCGVQLCGGERLGAVIRLARVPACHPVPRPHLHKHFRHQHPAARDWHQTSHPQSSALAGAKGVE